MNFVLAISYSNELEKILAREMISRARAALQIPASHTVDDEVIDGLPTLSLHTSMRVNNVEIIGVADDGPDAPATGPGILTAGPGGAMMLDGQLLPWGARLELAEGADWLPVQIHFDGGQWWATPDDLTRSRFPIGAGRRARRAP